MNCDRIARWYRLFEYLAFGRALERRRLAFLDAVADARRVLILGDGDGRFTAEFVRRNSIAQVESIDLSAKMLELAKRRALGTKVRFRQGDARTIELGGAYDLIVTHFFLDCFTEVELDSLVGRVTTYCEPGARWLVSDFRLPAAGMARWAARVLIRFMYFFFWVMTGLEVTQLPDHVRVLEQHKFQLQHRQSALGALLVSELWSNRSDDL